MNLVIGDEFTPGFNLNIDKVRGMSNAWSKFLNDKTIVGAIKGDGITLKNHKSLLHQIKQFSFAAYDRILLFCGTNDYLHSKANLGEIGEKLTQAISLIREHSHCTIYGILPLPIYRSNGHSFMQDRGPSGYTLQDLINMLDVTYSNNGISALNWLLANPVVSQFNFSRRLINGRYPNQKTSDLMMSRVRDFIKKSNSVYIKNKLSGVSTIDDNDVTISFSNSIKDINTSNGFDSYKYNQLSSALNTRSSVTNSVNKAKMFDDSSLESNGDRSLYPKALHKARYNINHASGAYAQMITRNILNDLIKVHKDTIKTKSKESKIHLEKLERGILG